MARVLHTQHLIRSLALGARITTKAGAPVTYAPRKVKDNRPWVDEGGVRWLGQQCAAHHPELQPAPAPPARPVRELPPGVTRRIALRKRYRQTGIDWDAELGEAS